MGFAVLRPEDQRFDRPSWRPEEQVRSLVELPRHAELRHSRANLWRYPAGAHGRRHIQLVQEEVFVVLEGTFTMLLGEPPERHELPRGSVVVVEPRTPLKLANESDGEGLVFVYGAPEDPSAEILEDVPPGVKKVIGPKDVPTARPAPRPVLTPDELLSTTRAVRRRLDLSRPVPRPLIEECLALAVQAPTSSYLEDWHFVVVTDPELRRGLGELYRRGAEGYFRPNLPSTTMLESAQYLAEHIDEVPVLLVPSVARRPDGLPAARQASIWASIIPATWSFMLAARARGLGTAWTTFHLRYEREAAELLGIPFDEVLQAALVPVAYTKGMDFKPGRRKPLEQVVHWQTW
jgi:nitroreductase/quercetin dioxygenase-like cupin family protein